MVQEPEDVTVPQEWIDGMEKAKKSHLVTVEVAVHLMDAMMATEKFTEDEAKNMALLYLDKTING